jgi:O-antigen/teichoic acid export membrane protein
MSAPPSSAGRDARSAAVNFLSVAAQASMPAYTVLLTRMLGDAGYGRYEWSNKFVFFLSVLTLFGMDQATNRFVALAHAQGDEGGIARAVGTALRVVVVSGVVVAAAVFALAPWVAGLRHDAQHVALLRVLCTVPIFYHVVTVFITATQAAHVMRYGFWTRGVAQPLALFLVTAVALRAGAGSLGACLAVLAGMALTAVLAAVFYGRMFDLGATLKTALGGPTDGAMLRFATPLVSAGVLTSTLGYSDVLILGFLGVSERDVGAYLACMIYAQALSQVRSAFDPGVQALIPPLLERGEKEALRESLVRQTRWSAAIAAPLFVLFAGFSDVVLQVFGKGFKRGALALGFLSVGHLINAVALTPWLLPASGNTRVTARLSIVWGLAVIAALFVLVPRFGIHGAAVAAALGLGGLQISQSFFAWKITGVHGYSAALVKTALAAGGAFVVGRVVLALAPGHLVVRFGVAMLCATIVYLGLYLLTAHPEDRATARQLVKRLTERKSAPPSEET